MFAVTATIANISAIFIVLEHSFSFKVFDKPPFSIILVWRHILLLYSAFIEKYFKLIYANLIGVQKMIRLFTATLVSLFLFVNFVQAEETYVPKEKEELYGRI